MKTFKNKAKTTNYGTESISVITAKLWKLIPISLLTISKEKMGGRATRNMWTVFYRTLPAKCTLRWLYVRHKCVHSQRKLRLTMPFLNNLLRSFWYIRY